MIGCFNFHSYCRQIKHFNNTTAILTLRQNYRRYVPVVHSYLCKWTVFAFYSPWRRTITHFNSPIFFFFPSLSRWLTFPLIFYSHSVWSEAESSPCTGHHIHSTVTTNTCTNTHTKRFVYELTGHKTCTCTMIILWFQKL